MSTKAIQTRNRKKKQKIDHEEDDEPSALALLFTEKWREIFEEHILPKLENGNELKFLNMSFKNARDAVERSKIKVEDEFNISEFTSISQMDYAWDNYHWGKEWDGTQEYFCVQVARTNKLEYLVWVREVKNCAWDSNTIDRAASQGNLAIVKYCVESECPMDAWTCACAAQNGHLDVLKYLHENGCPWSSNTCYIAHNNNQIDCLNYLIEQKCPKWEKFDVTQVDYDPAKHYSDSDEEEDEFKFREFTSVPQMELAWDNYRCGENGRSGTQKSFCSGVARTNKLEYLVWLREVKNCDWDSMTIYWAARQGNLAMVKYCVENECPMNEGACEWAALEGHLDVLKYLHENGCPWDSWTIEEAAKQGNLAMVKYCVENECPMNEGAYEWAAKKGHLDVLKYLHENDCPWDSRTIEEAAAQGNLAMVKYCVENGCPMDAYACEYAAQYGHLDVLKYLHENDCPWDSRACFWAHYRNHIDCLNYLIEQKCPGFARYV
jgi:hypothetical protein